MHPMNLKSTFLLINVTGGSIEFKINNISKFRYQILNNLYFTKTK